MRVSVDFPSPFPNKYLTNSLYVPYSPSVSCFGSFQLYKTIVNLESLVHHSTLRSLISSLFYSYPRVRGLAFNAETVDTYKEANTICPTTRNTCATDELAHPASERGISEDPTQNPNPHYGSGDPPLPKTYSDYAEPSERSASADPDPEELALGDQIQEMLDIINEHMDEVTSIHNMSRQAAQLLAKPNESNSALEARTRTLRTRLIAIREKYPTIAKGKSSIRPRDPQKDYDNEDLDPHLNDQAIGRTLTKNQRVINITLTPS
ncbi:hypothetical protein M422DRAFT_259279 [Sphaerobolus stellatus SS14]|uniref:Uncharacterized protein n=1 Tax=Sphaerobolus stellatus (strain SS14) TaxID=990650 RepID=A0A0C9UTB4_SPHS4|nr:hypothetical protein M422DRAFT_259279 [Sphaerobolus stellatus SS14]